MSNQFGKYIFYCDAVRGLSLFTGLWPRVNPSILYRAVPFAHGAVALLTSCAILNFCLRHLGSLNLFLKGLSLALSYLTMVQKVKRRKAQLDLRLARPCFYNPSIVVRSKTICLMFYRKLLVELHETLAATFRRDFNDAELRPILLSPLSSFYRPSLVLSVVTYTVNASFWITPMIAALIQLSRGLPVVGYMHPLPTVYPWSIDANRWLYPMTYAFEVWAGICLGSLTSIVDSLFGYYIFQITGQLRTLSHRVRRFSSREDYRKVLSDCVARHQILTRCQDQLERIYGPIVLWMLVTSAMVMCGLIYQASHMSPGRAAFVALYIVMKAVQTLLYGWFGTVLSNENELFREAIYASDWPGSGEKCLMTDVLVMMTYKPFVLKACSLSTISVDMFVAVSNTALSYFFMLRTLEED